MGHTAHVHVGEHHDSESTKTNKFELAAAVLLGVAGIVTALSSFQAGMWGGKMSERYSRSNKIATVAAAERSQALVTISKDVSVEIQAFQQLMQVDDYPGAKDRTTKAAGLLFVYQLSDQAYAALGLPVEIKDGLKSGDTTGTDIQTQLQELVDDVQNIHHTQELSINKEYQDSMLAKSNELTSEAEKVFTEGVEAKENGDHFDLAEVILAVSLFFTGISLVFRTKIRWAIISAGFFFLIAGVVYIATIPWIFS